MQFFIHEGIMRFKRKRLVVLAGMAFAGVAMAGTQMTLKDEITLSQGANGHKPKIQRAADGTLLVVYGDSRAGIGSTYDIYDTKAQVERPARDIYARWCKPDATKTCDSEADWSAPYNVSQSAEKYSISTDWKGKQDGSRLPFYGNIDKPNIKTSGNVAVLTWVSAYCPDGDLRDGVLPAADAQNTQQRAIRYLERDMRVIPFHCAWTAYSPDFGKTWKGPFQLSNGERDAKQDSSAGTWDATNKEARIAISWQEDPEGLQLGEADGPGDGASGANVTGGTDVWYTYFTVQAPAGTNTMAMSNPADMDGMERAFGYRVTDNWELEKKKGLPGQIVNVFDYQGNPVDGDDVHKGSAGAARPNIGMVGTTTVLAWEETKGSEGLAEGKFVRYMNFPYASPPNALAAKAGCIISNPLKNARRVRFLTQSAADATGVAANTGAPGRSGINIALFWKEGIYDKGGPSDIVVRRGMVDPNVDTKTQSGLAPARMVPAVATNCETSDFTEAVALANAPADNVSSNAPTTTTVTDDTEANWKENALAHRGVLRGDELWIGFNYTNDLVRMWAQLDNYNFWVRQFSYNAGGGSWARPRNVTNVTDVRINVREPRFFGTPPSNTNPGFCDGTETQDASFCQDRNTIFLMWGSQENVSPYDPPGDDLGIYASVSLDGGASFAPAIRFSEEKGPLFDDDETAYETQPAARPDGRRFYGVFNTDNLSDGSSAARYRSGDVTADAGGGDGGGDTGGGGDSGGGGGCTITSGSQPFDPVLPALVGLGLMGLGLRRARRG